MIGQRMNAALQQKHFISATAAIMVVFTLRAERLEDDSPSPPPLSLSPSVQSVSKSVCLPPFVLCVAGVSIRRAPPSLTHLSDGV